MIYVADTHAFLWWATRPSALGRAAARVFARAERGLDEVRLPAVAAFEIVLLVERGRIKTQLGVDEWLAALGRTPGLVIEPVRLEDIGPAHELEPLVDPFDRLIAGVARRLDAPLLTADERITRSRLVKTIWD